jgi:hypothetical protein
MTIDERLERLAERHQALAESMELMNAQMVEQGLRTDLRIGKILAAIEKDAENIRALVRIAEIQERRLTDLEGKSGAS